jgi:hypothetical protein
MGDRLGPVITPRGGLVVMMQYGTPTKRYPLDSVGSRSLLVFPLMVWNSFKKY